MDNLFPIVSNMDALHIAVKACTPSEDQFKCYDQKPENVRAYGLPESESCWWVYAPWNDGQDGTILRSGRILAISKLTGEILYDGTAGDEG